MCNNGIPVFDISQMSESMPTGDHEALLQNMENILTSYYRRNPSKTCVKRTTTPTTNKIIVKQPKKTLNIFSDMTPSTITANNNTAT